MYFLDFMKKPLPKGSLKLVLSGENELLKMFVLDRIKRERGVTLKWISKPQEYREAAALPLFNFNYLHILSTSCDFIDITGIVIKLSKTKMTAPFKKAGFKDIICSDLFPSQVEELSLKLAEQNNVDKSMIGSVAYLVGHDLYEIHNIIQVLSYLDNVDPAFVYNIISMVTSADSKRALHYLLEGEQVHFVNSLYNPNIKLSEFCWLLSSTLGNIKSAINHKGRRNWYQNKMCEAGQKIGIDRIDLLFSKVSDLCLSFESNDSIIRLRLNRFFCVDA